MLTLSLFCTFLVGLLAALALAPRLNAFEASGLAFPIGIGLLTLLMLLTDFVGIPLTAASVWVLTALLLGGTGYALWRRRASMAERIRQAHRPEWRKMNLVLVMLVGIVGALEYMNWTKCLYFPTFDRDSLAGFDTIGYVVAQEHTLHGLSLFDPSYMPHMHAAGSYISYIPMVQLSYAYAYLMGAATSKLIPALMFASLLVAFGGCMYRWVGRTGAAAATLGLLMTPEMVAFSSLSATNVIHAVYASMGVIYLALWFRTRSDADLWLGVLLLGLNLWTRMDGIAFVGAAAVVMAADALRRRTWRPLAALSAALIPVVVWAAYSRTYGLTSESIAILRPFWDGEKAALIGQAIGGHLANTGLYGWTFVLAALSGVANVWFLVRRRDNLPLLCMILTAIGLYMASLYQVNYIWDSIGNVLAYSAKRFLFCFVPMAWCYAFGNEWMVRLWRKVEQLLA